MGHKPFAPSCLSNTLRILALGSTSWAIAPLGEHAILPREVPFFFYLSKPHLPVMPVMPLAERLGGLTSYTMVLVNTLKGPKNVLQMPDLQPVELCMVT